jgi:hypothetical protein
VADDLIRCDHHFQALVAGWRARGKDPRHGHVKVALRFCRIADQMVAGRPVSRPPGIQGRPAIPDKPIAFHREHQTGAPRLLADLQTALGQVPEVEDRAEAEPPREEFQRGPEGGRRGPPILGDILPIVLARPGVTP